MASTAVEEINSLKGTPMDTVPVQKQYPKLETSGLFLDVWCLAPHIGL